MRNIKFNMLYGEDYIYTEKRKDIGYHMNLLGESDSHLEVPINQLQEVFNQQYIFSPALTLGRADIDFISADLIFIDFDTGYRIEDFKKDAKKYKLKWALIYKSMSYTEEHHKFRVGFIINKTITKREEYKLMLDSLKVIFKDMDGKSMNVSRFYYPKKADTDIIVNTEEYYKRTISKTSIEKALDKAVSEHIKTLESKDSIDLYLKEYVYKYMPYRKYDTKKNEFEKEWYSPSLIKDYCIKGDIFQKKYTTSEYVVNGNYKSPNYRINKTDLSNNCQLMSEFFKGNYNGIEKGGHYNSLLKIGTTLSLVRFKDSKSNNKTKYGELEHITKVINKYGQVSNTNTDSNTKRKVKEWLNSGKEVVSCDGYFTCPYKDRCNTFNSFGGLTQMIKSNCEECYEYELSPSGIDKEEARKKFNSDFTNALKSNVKYHNFTAPTGIGKTHTIVNTLEPKEKEVFIILAPTHKLIKEEYSKFPHTKENIELPQRCKFLHLLGYEGTLSKEEKTIMKQHNKISMDNINILLNNSIVVTTHKMFALKGEEVVEKLKDQGIKVTVIVDEDITGEYIYTDSISIGEFKENIDNLIKDIKFQATFMKKNEKDEYTEKDIETRAKNTIKKLRKIKGSEEFYNELKLSNTDKAQIINLKTIINPENYNIEFIKHILRGELYYFKSHHKNNICFINKHPLPKNVKYIFLSATPNRVGIDLLTSNCLINDYNYKIETKTKVSQLNHNTSKYGLKDGISDIPLNKIKELIVNPDNTLLVSFKDKEKEMKDLLGLKHSLHFGNVKGYNEFKGMDVIVVGTPYPSDEIKKLYGILHGFTSESDYDMYYRGPVTLGPNSYKIMSYKHPFLNYLQLELMTQELYQSIGRSRYLDNDVNISIIGKVPVREISPGYALIKDSRTISLRFFI